MLCVRITLYSQSPLHLLAASSQSLDSLITTSAVTFRVLATLTAVVFLAVALFICRHGKTEDMLLTMEGEMEDEVDKVDEEVKRAK